MSKFLFWLKDQAFTGSINASSLGNPTIGEILEQISAVVGRAANVQKTGNDADCTPFIGAESNTMNVDQALRFGATFLSVKDWLPSLIRHYH